MSKIQAYVALQQRFYNSGNLLEKRITVLEQHFRSPNLIHPTRLYSWSSSSFNRGTFYPTIANNQLIETQGEIIAPVIVEVNGYYVRLRDILLSAKKSTSFREFTENLSHLKGHTNRRPAEVKTSDINVYKEKSLEDLYNAARFSGQGDVDGKCFLFRYFAIYLKSLYEEITNETYSFGENFFFRDKINEWLSSSHLWEEANDAERYKVEALIPDILQSINDGTDLLSPDKMPIEFRNRVLLHIRYPRLAPLPEKYNYHEERFPNICPRSFLDEIICTSIENWI